MLRAYIFLASFLVLSPLPAQGFEFLPGTEYDPAVPTMHKVLGFAPAERMCTHVEVERYCQALADASDRVLLRRHGESWERRGLHHLVIGSPANLQRLQAIQRGVARLADPRGLDQAAVGELCDSLPSIAWLGFSVHGDEVSCTDAALFLAYHLAAANNDPVADAVRANSIVILDPLLNPDGRERFVFHYRQTRGRWPDAEAIAAEHNQPWPGGRSNHYLFDMNRDWIAATQPETQARIALFQQWWPQVFVDVHTMGRNSSYYFPPPAKPINPAITKTQREWLHRYGKNNARWFDKFGFDYFTRESFDAFYPGYGEGWPMFHGAIGMTYEQASVRGLMVRRDDDTVLRFRDAVRHHFVACLSTVETCATNRRAVLQAFAEYRRSATRLGETGEVREYLLPPGRDPVRTQRLADLLVRQGVEVYRATAPLKCASAANLRAGDGKRAGREFPAGTFVVRLDQPASRLAHVLLARHFEMDAEFLAEQKQKHVRRQRTGFYDLTAWSLPLLFGVECHVSHAQTEGAAERYRGATAAAKVGLARAKVAYLLPWGGNGTAAALAELLRAGVRAHCAGKKFRIGTREYAPGCLIVKSGDNGDPAALHQNLVAVATTHGAEVVPLDSSWVDDGIHFGSNEVRYLPKPKVAMLWDRPVSGYSAGQARFVLEQQFGQPVTIIRTRQLAVAELRRFNVLVMPSGRYGSELESATDGLKTWVREGGTLIAIGDAVRWLSGKKVGLLATAVEDRTKPKKNGKADPGEKKPDAKPAAKPAKPADKLADKVEPFDYEQAILPDKERPVRTSGAILDIRLDREHWLAFGYDGRCNAVSTSSNIFTPVKLDKGTNVGVYGKREQLLLGGFAFGDKLDQLADKAWLVHQPHGRGHVVAFTEDPNYRAFTDGLNLLFMNAVLLGPGF